MRAIETGILLFQALATTGARFLGSSDYTYFGHNTTSICVLVRPCVPRWGVENVAANLITCAFPRLTVPKPGTAGQAVEDNQDFAMNGKWWLECRVLSAS